MTWRDTLELRSRENPSVRKDNLPPSRMPPPEMPASPQGAPQIPMSRGDRALLEPSTVSTTDDLPPQD
jgi:hypothetical protein